MQKCRTTAGSKESTCSAWQLVMQTSPASLRPIDGPQAALLRQINKLISDYAILAYSFGLAPSGGIHMQFVTVTVQQWTTLHADLTGGLQVAH
jgi:hypothetical protein